MTRLRVTCSWQHGRSPADPSGDWYREGMKYHQDHGADLAQCDSWECQCGNHPNAEGFHPCDASGRPADHTTGEPELYLDDRCGRIYDSAGYFVNWAVWRPDSDRTDWYGRQPRSMVEPAYQRIVCTNQIVWGAADEVDCCLFCGPGPHLKGCDQYRGPIRRALAAFGRAFLQAHVWNMP